MASPGTEEGGRLRPWSPRSATDPVVVVQGPVGLARKRTLVLVARRYSLPELVEDIQFASDASLSTKPGIAEMATMVV